MARDSALENWGEWRSGNVTANLGGKQSMVWQLFTNDLFIVTAVPFHCEYGPCVHLVMRLKPDATPLSGLTWAAKQRVKDELMGAGRMAVEVFPPRKELVDQADAYHLWVLPEGFKLPFGVEEASGV